VPRSRFDELAALAEENDGLVTAEQARAEGAIKALFKTRSLAVYGVDAHLLDVEVDMHKSSTVHHFITVGLPDTAVREHIVPAAMAGAGSPWRN